MLSGWDSFASGRNSVAAIGVYGVMSYVVTLRTKEMGIRMALGARPGQVLHLVVGEGLMLGAAGSAIGLAGALVLRRFLLLDCSASAPWILPSTSPSPQRF